MERVYSEEFKVEMVKRIKAYPWKSNFKDELLFYFDELYSSVKNILVTKKMQHVDKIVARFHHLGNK
jgi:hypothetical protein